MMTKENNIQSSDKELDVKLNRFSKLLIAIGFLAIVLSFFAPYLFTLPNFRGLDFTETGQIGDTIGGIMNPFIAIAGVIASGLAFYLQYRANILQRNMFYKQLQENKTQFETELTEQKKQSKLDKFEAQFYEMLRLHKENVNELELKAARRTTWKPYGEDGDVKYKYDYYTVSKRNAFVELKNEFEYILLIYKRANNITELSSKDFHNCYQTFFWGISIPINATLVERMQPFDKADYRSSLLEIQAKQYSEEIMDVPDNINFDIEAFRGHSEFLGHYFRHIFHTVKFVVNQPDSFISYIEKRQYLRVLRAQLSNHEQIMLFYNWLSGYGKPWEDDKNKFFTEFVMIHNLWYQLLIDDSFIKSKIQELRDKPVELRKDELFEID